MTLNHLQPYIAPMSCLCHCVLGPNPFMMVINSLNKIAIASTLINAAINQMQAAGAVFTLHVYVQDCPTRG